MNAPFRHKAHTFAFTAYIYRGRSGREYPVEVTYSVTPGCPEQGPTYACGGQPAEPDVVEIVSAVIQGDTYDLTAEEWDQLQDEAEQLAPDALADEAAAYADYRFEEYRERIAPGAGL
jgi:hypothetical protein